MYKMLMIYFYLVTFYLLQFNNEILVHAIFVEMSCLMEIILSDNIVLVENFEIFSTNINTVI